MLAECGFHRIGNLALNSMCFFSIFLHLYFEDVHSVVVLGVCQISHKARKDRRKAHKKDIKL